MTPEERIKEILEQAVAREEGTSNRFSMSAPFKAILPALEETLSIECYKNIKASLAASFTNKVGKDIAEYVLQSIFRHAFLIEAVRKPSGATNMSVRWDAPLDQNDYRYASYDKCFEIFEMLVSSLKEDLDEQENRQLLKLFKEYGLLSYELPLDYKNRVVGRYIHSIDNFTWMWDELPKRTLKLRSLLLAKKRTANKNKTDQILLLEAAYSKIVVKTYLTDRAQTGDYKTNREKRWETEPESVQFALRRDCLEIEYTLVQQLCRFKDFPSDISKLLEEEGLLEAEVNGVEVVLANPPHLSYEILKGSSFFRCPITMDELDFDEFQREVTDPEHGKASFQVGHKNPLKAINDDPYSGHSAQNISWISADGNRIQGHLSLKEARALIRKIYKNYEDVLDETTTESQEVSLTEDFEEFFEENLEN
ncbi:hypothetical protein K9N68_16565 [Kovacikia minuta CCNUW1]|uniref:hypothetical protein n=1 Tax=Kovacikia minuta TaxID=2931930 RepID=UPI001CC9EEE1|nr:hypothetical protein [Kovacikia minuta]UBF29299.1 hypothetical protein K9N68_16565 [Kovacikia minuta CCNUW1]